MTVDSPSPDAPVGPPEPADRPTGVWVRLEALAERLFILFSLYVLSIGPLYWQWYGAKYVSGPPLLAAFYEPLWILAGWCPPLGEWINWYVRLWVL